MKSIYFNIPLLLVLSSMIGYGQTDLQKQNFQGKVHVVKETEFDVLEMEDGSLHTSVQNRWVEYEFNEAGNLIGWGDFYMSGQMSWFYRKEYSEDGWLLSQIFYLPEDIVTAAIYYEYDNYGHELSWIKKTPEDSVVYSWHNTFDKKGNKIKSKACKGLDDLEKYYVFLYNKKGQRISESWCNPDGTVTKLIKTKYDEFGNPVEIYHFDAEKNMTGKWVQKFDAKKLLTESIVYKSEAEKVSRTSYLYDDFANVTEIKFFDKLDTLLNTKSFTYNYDARNNWIQKTEYLNGDGVKSCGRLIGYFE